MSETKQHRQDTCCTQPTAEPNYTVCFPEQQVIPNGTTQANPYYDYVNRQSFWTYRIQIDSGGSEIKDLSHWVLQICPELAARKEKSDFQVEVQENPPLGPFINVTDYLVETVDPPTGIANVLKIERPQLKGTNYIYRITIKNTSYFDLAAEAGIVAIKAGNDTAFNSSTCNPPLPTPSVNCNTVDGLYIAKTCPTGNFTVNDQPVINLQLTNNGGPASGVTVIDTISIPDGITINNIVTNPAGAVINPASGPYTNQTVTVTWNNLSIPASSSLPLSVQFTVTAVDSPGTIQNIKAEVNGIIGSSTTCAVNIVLPAAELNIAKTCPAGTFTVNDRPVINLQVTNSGGPASGVTVVDTISIPAGVTINNIVTNPAGAVINPASGSYTNQTVTVTWNNLSIPASSSLPLSVQFTVISVIDSSIITNVNAKVNNIAGEFTSCLINVAPTQPPVTRKRGIKLSDFNLNN